MIFWFYFRIFLGGIRIDDPFHGGNKLLELEGLFQSEDPNCDRCLDNATMNIKITPEREFFGLDLSLVSSFKSETHHKFLRLPFIPFHMRKGNLRKFALNDNNLWDISILQTISLHPNYFNRVLRILQLSKSDGRIIDQFDTDKLWWCNVCFG